VLCLWTALTFAAPPPAYVVTPEEEARLAKGEVVIRHSDSESGASVVAFANVKASPADALAEAMDLADRKAENNTITGLDIYLKQESPERLGARWELTIMGSKIVFHAIYECHRPQGYCSYALDPTRPNDLAVSEGHYVAVSHSGGSRLIYVSRTDSGRSMPGWIRRWIASSSLTSQVEGIRKRAEAR